LLLFDYIKGTALGQTNETQVFDFRYLFQALNDKIINWDGVGYDSIHLIIHPNRLF